MSSYNPMDFLFHIQWMVLEFNLYFCSYSKILFSEVSLVKITTRIITFAYFIFNFPYSFVSSSVSIYVFFCDTNNFSLKKKNKILTGILLKSPNFLKWPILLPFQNVGMWTNEMIIYLTYISSIPSLDIFFTQLEKIISIR